MPNHISVSESANYTCLNSNLWAKSPNSSFRTQDQGGKRIETTAWGNSMVAQPQLSENAVCVFCREVLRDVLEQGKKHWNIKLSDAYIYTASEEHVFRSQILTRLQTLLGCRDLSSYQVLNSRRSQSPFEEEHLNRSISELIHTTSA